MVRVALGVWCPGSRCRSCCTARTISTLVRDFSAPTAVSQRCSRSVSARLSGAQSSARTWDARSSTSPFSASLSVRARGSSCNRAGSTSYSAASTAQAAGHRGGSGKLKCSHAETAQKLRRFLKTQIAAGAPEGVSRQGDDGHVPTRGLLSLADGCSRFEAAPFRHLHVPG